MAVDSVVLVGEVEFGEGTHHVAGFFVDFGAVLRGLFSANGEVGCL